MPTSRQWWYGAVAACAGDIATTWYGIERLGVVEQNPVVAGIFEMIGVLPGLVLSKLFVLAFAVVMWHLIDEHRWALPAIVTVIYGLVFVLNAIQIVVVA